MHAARECLLTRRNAWSRAPDASRPPWASECSRAHWQAERFSCVNCVLGRAHGSQISSALRKRWLRELKRASSRKLDAPSWLWSSVVELIGLHEQAYLQFCLRYARTTRRASP